MELLINPVRPLHAVKTEPVEMKVFVDRDPIAVQHSVNNWLKANNVTIQHYGQSQSEKNGNFVFIVTLLYTPSPAD
jgi:hypothetical protein